MRYRVTNLLICCLWARVNPLTNVCNRPGECIMWRGGVLFILLIVLLTGTSNANAEEKVPENRTLLNLGGFALGLESNKRFDESDRAEIGPPKLSLGWKSETGWSFGAYGETRRGLGIMLSLKYRF